MNTDPAQVHLESAGVSMQKFLLNKNRQKSRAYVAKESHFFFEQVLESTMAGVEEIIGHKGANYWTVLSRYVSQQFIRPLVQKFPHKKGGSLVALYQEVSIHAALPGFLGDIALQTKDEMATAVRKRKGNLKHRIRPPPLKLDTPEDFLALQDLLLTPPHKKVHYVMDKNLNNDYNRSLSNNLHHIATLRRKSWPHQRKNQRVVGGLKNQILQSSFLPMGLGVVGSSMNDVHFNLPPPDDDPNILKRCTNLLGTIREEPDASPSSRSLPVGATVSSIPKINFDLLIAAEGASKDKNNCATPLTERREVHFTLDLQDDFPYFDATARQSK
uniref:Uncharacterized protein n=1 Tax=Romanomermis culicivorax TaxID=13658 RepID=A0A915IJU9_ROMCU